MRPCSSFDGKHLYCEKHRVWTNLLDPRWLGNCLDDEEIKPNEVGAEEEEEG